jgi:hypothetical protein
MSVWSNKLSRQRVKYGIEYAIIFPADGTNNNETHSLTVCGARRRLSNDIRQSIEDAVFELRVLDSRLVRDQLTKGDDAALRNRILGSDGRQWKHTCLLRAAFKLTSRTSSSDPFNIAVGGS